VIRGLPRRRAAERLGVRLSAQHGHLTRFAQEACFKALLRRPRARSVICGDTTRIATGAFTQPECRNYFSAVRYNANVSENA
jgi:hypothetical protein